jgi:hypothetical protein
MLSKYLAELQQAQTDAECAQLEKDHVALFVGARGKLLDAIKFRQKEIRKKAKNAKKAAQPATGTPSAGNP